MRDQVLTFFRIPIERRAEAIYSWLQIKIVGDIDPEVAKDQKWWEDRSLDAATWRVLAAVEQAQHGEGVRAPAELDLQPVRNGRVALGSVDVFTPTQLPLQGDSRTALPTTALPATAVAVVLFPVFNWHTTTSIASPRAYPSALTSNVCDLPLTEVKPAIALPRIVSGSRIMFTPASSLFPRNELENVNLCPNLLGQKFFVLFLGKLEKTKRPFEIN